MKLFYDIETVPTALPWEPPEDDPDAFPPLPVHRIVSIGALMMHSKFSSVVVSGPCGVQGGWSAPPDERAILTSFLALMDNKKFGGDVPTLIDWNGRGFDMQIIQARCFHYGLPMPWYFEKQKDNYGKISSWSKEYRDRYGGVQRDMSDIWTNTGAARRPHLADLAALMGLPGKTDMDGGQVYGAYKEERYADIHRYCMQDVYQTALVTFRFLFISGKINKALYQHACKQVISDADKAKVHYDFLSKIDVPALMLESV